MDNKHAACGVFVDLQKAFDTVDHKILVAKLEHYGIRGIAQNWFKSYLSNRKQFVSIYGIDSDTMCIEYGVPQGSVLGPLLFLIYINDLHSSIPFSSVFHFADDTNLLNINKSSKRLRKEMNLDLKALYEWLLANKISLNVAKTEIIFFHMPGYPPPKLKIKLNGKLLLASPYIKYLGLYIDANLNFSHNTSVILKKLNRSRGMLSKVRHYVDETIIQNLYHSLFSSHLLYGAQVWGQSRNCHTEKLFTAQKKVIRTINFADVRAHSTPLFFNSKILKLEDTIKIMNIIFVKNCLDKVTPTCFHSIFTQTVDVHEHGTALVAYGGIFMNHFNTVRFGTKSITSSCVKDWNKILISCSGQVIINEDEGPIDFQKCPTILLKDFLVNFYLQQYATH